MQRQDSIGSQGSSASGMSGMSGMSAASSRANAGDGLGGPTDIIDQAQTIRTAVFGVLLTLFKERWEDSKRYVAARVLLEHLQLLLVLLQPYFLWAFNYKLWLWQIANYSLIKVLVIPAGDTVYHAVVFIMIAFMGLTLAACTYISWNFMKHGVVPRRWPVKILRFCMMVFYQVLYVAVLNFLLGPINCNWLSNSAKLRNKNVDFPERTCSMMPHRAVLAVSAVFSAVYVVVGGLFALADSSPNPVSQRLLATAHSTVEVKAWAFKTLIVLCINLLSGSWKLQAIPIWIFATWLTYIYIRWQPYYYGWVNHLRAGLYAMAAWVSFMLTINVWREQDAVESGLTGADLLADRASRASQLSTLAMGIMPVALVLGAAASWMRLYLAKRTIKKFRGIDLSDGLSALPTLKHIHKFVDEYEVEILARCCRVWTDFEDKELDPEAVSLAEVVIKAGLARFHSAHMLLIYANFLSSVQDAQQSANSQLQAATKLEPNMCDRYVMFVKEQQHMARLQQSTSAGHESAVDLVGYVEFQRSYRQVLSAHKSALYAQRSFWKVLLHNDVRFTALVHAFRTIDSCRSKAERAYQTVLERYPSNIKLLRAYARFLEHVKNDPWSASKCYTEADKLEELEGGQAAELLAQDEDNGNGVGHVDERNTAVCVINATGTIQMANKVLLKMLGYRKGELEGKNVSVLMPQPYSGRHNTYLRNYQQTGKPKVLGRTTEVVALHKEHNILPIMLAVTKVSGTGDDALFMGVLRPLVEDTNSMKAHFTPGGLILCVDSRFTDWFGKLPSDCVGHPFCSLSVDPEPLNKLLDQAVAASEEELKAGHVCVKNVMLTHKFAEPQPVDITVQMAGNNDQRLFVAVINRLSSGELDNVMVVDHRGQIKYSTSQLAALLGGTTQTLINQEITRFMPQPFMQLHGRWMRDVQGKPPANSCRAGCPVMLMSLQRAILPATLDITTQEQGENNIYTVKVAISNMADALLCRRLSLKIDNSGNIVETSDTPQFVFGFKPSMMVGRNLSDCLDVFMGLPESGGKQGMDMEHVLAAMVAKTLTQKDISWRCGLHMPMTKEEVAKAQANVIQANILANQTKAALISLEVTETETNMGVVEVSIIVHLWRAEQLMSLIEVDKQGLITKTGTCQLDPAGLLLGVPSAAMLHTPLSKWLNMAGTYESLLIDQKKRGALKRKAADVKVGPLKHASGRHSDGDKVYLAVQAVVKEGTGPERLVVKLSMEKPKKGHPSFVRRMLGLEATKDYTAGAMSQREQNYDGDAEEDDVIQDGQKSYKARGGVKFGAVTAREAEPVEDEAHDHGAASEDESKPKQKSSRVAEWVRQASGLTDATAVTGHDGLDIEESMGTVGLGPDSLPPGLYGGMSRDGGLVAPPEINLTEQDMAEESADEAASQQSGSELNTYQSDFRRGKRLKKLINLLNSKQAQQASTRFYKHTVLVILALICAHIICFAVSVTLIDSQKDFIDEVVGAGTATIALHQMAISCRVMEALHDGVSHPDIFTYEIDHVFEDMFIAATETFQQEHERTYLGKNKMRRLENLDNYKLKDYWEKAMWNVTDYVDSGVPYTIRRQLPLWDLGNEITAAAREFTVNHEHFLDSGGHISEYRFWRFIMDNAAHGLFDGYKMTIYGLSDRVVHQLVDVNQGIVVLLVAEGCVLFMIAGLYVFLLIKTMVVSRGNLFSVFLVIPTGFLRALANKQVQLDEDDDSDNDSDAGEGQHMDQAAQQQEVQKLNIFTKKGKKDKGAGANNDDWFVRKNARRKSFWSKINPLSWFGSQKGNLDTGKKQLVRNSQDAYVITAPFVFWGCVLVLVYTITLLLLRDIRGPFRMLSVLNILVFRVIRTVVAALEVTLAPTAAEQSIAKAGLKLRLDNMEKDYISFLYGFNALADKPERNALTVDEPAVFETVELANTFFRSTSCMRSDKSTCFPPGHHFYEVTHNGLDGMTVRLMTEASMMLSDNFAVNNISSSRLRYVWQVGMNDVFNGMYTADLEFRAAVENMFSQVRTIHYLTFALTLAGALFLWLGIVRPHLKQAHKETRQMAEMLSQLPPEMDVEGLVAQATVGDLDDNA